MALAQQTVLNQREILSDGTVQVRFALQVMNGDAVLQSQWHRGSFPPGSDADMIVAAINSNIAQADMGSWPPISDEDAAKIKGTCQAEWTPEVIAAFQAKLAAITDQAA